MIQNNYHKDNNYKEKQIKRQSQIVFCEYCKSYMLYSSYWPHIKNSMKHKKSIKKLGIVNERIDINTIIINDNKIIEKIKNDKKVRREERLKAKTFNLSRTGRPKKNIMIGYKEKIIKKPVKPKSLVDKNPTKNQEKILKIGGNKKVINEPNFILDFE
jgi:hypothetical protein